jgi:hypothetical protein
MTLQNKIRDQLEASMSFYVHDNVWLLIPPLPVTEKLYFHVEDATRLAALDTAGRLIRYVSSNLKKYDFNK